MTRKAHVEIDLSIGTDAFVGAIREAALAIDKLLRTTSVVYAAGYEIKIKHGRKILAGSKIIRYPELQNSAA